jgi:integrase
MKITKLEVCAQDGTKREYWQVDLRYRKQGMRRRFPTKAAAQAFAEPYRRAAKRGRPTGKPPTVAAFVAEFLAARRGTCAPATFTILTQQLGHVVRYPVRPDVVIGTSPLTVFDGDPDLINAMLKWYRDQGYAVHTVRLFRNALKELLDRATSRHYLVAHPLHDTQLQRDLRGFFKTERRAEPEQVKAFTADQARHFLTIAATHSRLYPVFATGFATGPRLGELLALWTEDDQPRQIAGLWTRQLHIARALTQRMSRRTPQPGQLKNGANYYVDVPAQLGTILDHHRQTLRPDAPWLFQTTTGTPYSHEHVQGEFKRLLRLAGLEDPRYDFTPHSMRHTFASLHILAGKPAKWVSEQLGHKDVVITLRTYASWFRQACPGAADTHGQTLFGPAPSLGGNSVAITTLPPATNPAITLH